ncbi:secretin N-terminal domain-containing protein [Botrimarina hoheduenensis]|uniref:Type II secretion system protein D n=1 Tax=Botrimarina hoheduenensis TaxID=2528000 RepID=A0A5C5WD65_9BACT|nr:secretin N-terminal domain-containing protein [Botrimarina hoheduenensis]TWT48866.1 Type II secretion system protein D precursor [Botrimarina hoheduenensis]
MTLTVLPARTLAVATPIGPVVRRVFLSVAISLGLTGVAATALAAPQLNPPTGVGVSSSGRVMKQLARRGDLTLRNSSLEAALFTISELWGINIVAGEVPGSVNGVFKDAPLREILDSILLSNGYAYRPVGESLVVSRLAELGQINPFFVSETIAVGAAEVGEVVEAARLMSTPQGQVRAMPSAGAVLVVDFPDRVEKIRELIGQIDRATRGMGQPGGSAMGPQRLEVAYFRTHFVPAADAQLALNVVLSPQGRIAAIDQEDRLLVVDYAENLAMVEVVLARIDRPRPQVKIQALIYDINLTDIEEIGVNWNALVSGTTDGTGNPTAGDGALFNTVTKTPFDAAGTGGSFTFFSLNADLNLQAVVLALQQADDSRLLASPNVTVIDNEEAIFQSVSEIPFQQLTQTGAGGQIGTTSFRDAGISLKVTPKVASDRTINLKIAPEFSRLTGFTPGDNQPIIDRRTASTRVRVANGQTLMIGGLRQRNDVGNFDGVPLLKDIRYLGHLFRARETQIEESELVVFITPEIVGYADGLATRDQLAADTVRCRLDRIPAPEGCPTCDACQGTGCETCGPGTSTTIGFHEGPASLDQTSPEMAPIILGPEVSQPDETPVLEPLEAIERGEPSSPSAALSPARHNPADLDLRMPLLTSNPPRRLPPIGSAAPTSSPPLATPPIAPVEAVADKTAFPLRKSYDERFRASGSLTQPRVAAKLQSEADTTTTPSEPEKPGRFSSITERFWR